MSTEVLRLSARSHEELVARRLLGRGVVLQFECEAQTATLTIKPVARSTPMCDTATTWECAHGQMTLSNAGPLLSMVSQCPVVLSEQPTLDADWFWTLYNDGLADTVAAALGHIMPLQGGVETHQTLAEDTLRLGMEVYRGETHARGVMSLTPGTLSNLLEAGHWSPITSDLSTDMSLVIPLVLGRLSMPAGAIRSLQTGDVVLPQHNLFDVMGNGIISLGRQSLHVSFSEEGTTLVVTKNQGKSMSDNRDDMLSDDEPLHEHVHVEDDGYGSDRQSNIDSRDDFEEAFDSEDTLAAEGDFDNLALSLTVRCGTLSMTLGELRRLGQAGLITIEGASPGMASLYHGDRPLAHGELVSIDGQLALQINQLEIP